MKTAQDWKEECQYISNVTDKVLHSDLGEKHKAMRNFGYERSCFESYCEMQRDVAARDGFDDAAQYIQHCLDDLSE